MVRIRIGNEGLRRIRRLVDNLVAHCTLQIVQNMSGSLPVNTTRIGVESGKYSGCLGDVWPCGDGKIHEGSNNGDVGAHAHFCSFCIVLG